MILVIDNYDSFTFNLVQAISVIYPSQPVHVARNDAITPRRAIELNPTHVVISPGPGKPEESGVSADIIHAFAGRVPVLGVCLGHQALAHVYRVPVVRARRPVHGTPSPVYHDNSSLFAGLPNPFLAMRYHSLIVPADGLPPDSPLTISAWTHEPIDPDDDPLDPVGPTRQIIMGLRHHPATGTVPVEGVQFHPESFLTPAGPSLLRNFLAAHTPMPSSEAASCHPAQLGP